MTPISSRIGTSGNTSTHSEQRLNLENAVTTVPSVLGMDDTPPRKHSCSKYPFVLRQRAIHHQDRGAARVPQSICRVSAGPAGPLHLGFCSCHWTPFPPSLDVHGHPSCQALVPLIVVWVWLTALVQKGASLWAWMLQKPKTE